MTTTLRTKPALAALASITLIGTLAGCSATSPSAGTVASGPASSGTATSGSTSSGGTSTNYKDGTYTEEGSYTSPGGQETISVELTLASNVVTAVTVKSVKADPTAQNYQSQFIGGISAVVVGKKIDSLSVSRVAGSSLTSQGFNAAITAIKADAS